MPRFYVQKAGPYHPFGRIRIAPFGKGGLRILAEWGIYDEENDKRLGFFTNNFELPALTIAQLYKCRWQVELFFKWIKQHLRIKAFFGTNENAVKTQIWIAISVYVLVAIVKKRLGVAASLYTILQILSLTLFEKTPFDQLLNDTALQNLNSVDSNQLNLFS